MNRTTIEIQRLSFGSLYKVHLMTCLGLCVPFCILGLLAALFDPGNIVLKDGDTMGSFYLTLASTPVIWAPLSAGFLTCAGWIALALKGAFSPTALTVIERAPTPPGLARLAAGVLAARPRVRPWMIVLGVGVGVAVGAFCLSFGGATLVPQKVRQAVASPDGEFTAVVAYYDYDGRDKEAPEEVRQFIELLRKAEAEEAPALAPGVELGRRGHQAASIGACADGDIEVRWTGPRTLLIRYTQAKPAMISWTKTVEGVSIVLEEKARE